MNVTVTNAASMRRSGNEWQYYDMRKNTMSDDEWWGIMSMMPTLVATALNVDSVTEKICGAGVISNFGYDSGKGKVKYIAIDMDVKQYGVLGGNQLMSFKEAELQLGVSIADILAPYGITPTTKEQFYSLDIEFTIDSESYTILSSQTWADWIESGNAPERFVVDNGYIKDSELSDSLATYYVALDGTQVASTDVILDKAYEIIESLGGGGGSAGA